MANTLIDALDNPFWRFSCALYAEPVIQKVFLRLQEQKGLNINLLLYCFWLGFAVTPLSKEDFLKTCDQVNQWHQEITNPLRALRKHLKILTTTENSGDRSDWVTDFYKNMLHEELCSEAWQQYQLYAQIKDRLRDDPHWDHLQIECYLNWLLDEGCSSSGGKKGSGPFVGSTSG